MDIHEQGAMSLDQFCKKFSVGKTKAYQEISEGQLRAHKLGRKTLVSHEAAQEWFSSLPEMHSQTSQA